MNKIGQYFPHSLNKTKTKSCIIACGPKKSGTYLLHSIIRELNYWQDINICYFNKTWTYGSNIDKVKYGYPNSIIKKIRNGQFAAGHIKYDNRIEKMIGNNTSYRNIKMIFIYRDPRDSMVSFMNFHKKDIEKMGRDYFPDCSNDSQRLVATIDIFKDLWQMQYYTKFTPWIGNKYSHSVKFEDLYLEILSLRDGVIGSELIKILQYLEINLDSFDPQSFYKKVFNKSFNASNEINKIGQYKRCFEKIHYSLLDNIEFRKELSSLGYKW